MALSTQRASISLPSAEEAVPRWKHDVFLSFRGVDTRQGIASLLYAKLENRRIKTFKDDQELQVGEAISPTLVKAIEESRFAIVVLSPNYASSPWCLDELAKISECMKGKDTILPLFYQVDPSDVRHQKKSFEVAFTKHEENSRQSKERLQQWRVALKNVADLSGWDSNNYECDEDLVKDIVEFVCRKVQPIGFESTMSTEGFEAFEATRQAMDEVIRALQDDEVTAIGVEGMGGVGKTTMVKHIAAQAQKKGHFDYVTMAVVSQSPDLLKIQLALAGLLSLKLREDTLIRRAGELRDRIMRGNRILIILDDVWEEIDLSSIGIPNYKELRRCNSKFILTTRRRNVCHVMRTQAVIILDILSEEDSWTLFVKNATMSLHESTAFYDVARKVATECAGLPIALVAVSKALGDKDIEEWKEAAQRLERSQTANLDDKGDVSKCIKLSYDYLRPDDHNIAKSFFLLCCLFPEDYDIAVEDVVMYAIGKGFFQDADTIMQARDTARSVAKYLKASSLLLDSEYYGCVKMHDVIRDVAISISSEDGQQFLVKAGCGLEVWPTINAHKGYSAISLMRNHIHNLPQQLVCPKLQILLLQSNPINEIPKTFFQSPNELRVLDLSVTSISLLPRSLRLLTDLQALYLDECDKKVDISIVRKLKKLEILSMRHCLLEELPKEVGKLKNLKMLDVTDACFETVPSEVISKLHGLQELYIKCWFSEWGSRKFLSLGKNAGFDELAGLSHLNSLRVLIDDVKCLPANVRCNPNWVNFEITIGRVIRHFFGSHRHRHRHPFQHLTVDTSMNTLPDWFISVVTEKAEIVEYNGSMGLKKTQFMGLNNILLEHDLGRLHRLKYLVVSDLPADEKLEVLMNSRTWVSNKPVFENLEEMYLNWVECLKELCIGELPPGSLCNLKVLSVYSCRKLVNALLPSNLLHRLENLEILNCDGISGMEYVFGFEGLEPEQMVLTKLGELALSSLAKLTSIWKGPAPKGVFHNLKTFAIRDCQKLKYLFTSNEAQCLLQLELLWVENCSGLARVIEPSEETEIKKVVGFPKLKEIYLISLPQLRDIDHIECSSLEHLYVVNCSQFSSSACVFPIFELDTQQHLEFPCERFWRTIHPGLPKFSDTIFLYDSENKRKFGDSSTL